MATKAELELVMAITEVLKECGDLEEGQALGDYVVMAERAGYTPENDGKTGYTLYIPGDLGIPMHRVIGLISVCSDLLEEE